MIYVCLTELFGFILNTYFFLNRFWFFQIIILLAFVSIAVSVLTRIVRSR